MRKLAVLAVAVAVAVFATGALSSNASVQTGQRQQVVSLQKQVNELRNELICLDTIAGNAVAADALSAQQATTSRSLTPETGVNDRGVCKKLGVVTQGTTVVPNQMIPPFAQLARRAFGG